MFEHLQHVDMLHASDYVAALNDYFMYDWIGVWELDSGKGERHIVVVKVSKVEYSISFCKAATGVCMISFRNRLTLGAAVCGGSNCGMLGLTGWAAAVVSATQS